MKKIKGVSVNGFFASAVTLTVFCGLLFYPEKAALGIKSGIELLLSVVIPSLFPFAVLSSYAANSRFTLAVKKIFGKTAAFLFNTDGSAATVFLLGITGGYPIGAKTALTLYKNGSLSADDARRLCFYCINAGPAFAISAVGSAMLMSFKSGVLLYISEILSALTAGILCRFFKSDDRLPENCTICENGENAFVNSVAEGARAMLNICAWVLTFSCTSSLADLLPFDKFTVDFLKGVLEVTTGCAFFAGKAPLPVIGAMLGFGGISVICQVMPYLQTLGVNKKLFFVSRAANAALNAFFTSVLVKLFPPVHEVFAASASNPGVINLSCSIPACIILLFLCILFILDVDYDKKVC